MTALAVRAALDRGGFALDVNLALSLDGVTAVFGASGSGKTTFLRIVAGLEREARGWVAFGESVWQDDAARTFTAPHRRRIGYVFQEARLFGHLSVLGNLRYGERRRRAADRRTGFDRVVEVLGIGPLLDRRPATLSGGEAQRVAIGRALLASPRLLLMDEPLASLDFGRKGEILTLIERARDELGVPILYVTHALDEVARLARDVAVLSKGRVAAHGPVTEVMARLDLMPLTGRFQAGAVLEGRVAGHDRRFALTRIEVEGRDLFTPEADLAAGTPVRLRVRARDVALALRRPEAISVRNVLPAVVAEVAPEAGAYAELSLRVGGQALRARLTRAAVHELGLAPGVPVFALVKAIALDRAGIGAPGDGEAVGTSGDRPRNRA